MSSSINLTFSSNLSTYVVVCHLSTLSHRNLYLKTFPYSNNYDTWIHCLFWSRIFLYCNKRIKKRHIWFAPWEWLLWMYVSWYNLLGLMRRLFQHVGVHAYSQCTMCFLVVWRNHSQEELLSYCRTWNIFYSMVDYSSPKCHDWCMANRKVTKYYKRGTVE